MGVREGARELTQSNLKALLAQQKMPVKYQYCEQRSRTLHHIHRVKLVSSIEPAKSQVPLQK